MAQQSTESGFPKQGVANVVEFESIKPMETTQASFSHSLWEIPVGETDKDALKLVFTRKLKLEFHGNKA